MPESLTFSFSAPVPLRLTPEDIERFLDSREGRYPRVTQEKYRQVMQRFYQELDESKQIGQGTVAWLRDKLLADGAAPNTVNVYLTVVNAYLDFAGHREYQLTERVPVEKQASPELTRSEYLRLLSTARLLEKERLYLIIKGLVCTGLPLPELLELTVETVRQGRVVYRVGRTKQIVRLPESLQEELLAYAKREGRHTGLVLVTRSGGPVDRANIHRELRQLCAEARVSPEKGTPRYMKKLYQATRAGVENNVSLLIEQAMERIVEQEQLTIGWAGA